MRRTETEVHDLLSQLLVVGENEVVEFKTAGTRFETSRLTQYVSALSNEANLANEPAAWLVFGVADDKTVEGTSFREGPGQLERLKQDVAQNLTGNHGIREIYEIAHPEGRVLLFEIPAAPRGIPIAANGRYCARNGESLGDLSQAKLDEIRRQSAGDWSAGIIEDARLEDLDSDALSAAVAEFATHHPSIPSEELARWDSMQFLEKVELVQQGQLTRAAVVLFGKPSALPLLGQVMPEVTWMLQGEERVYQHFELPFFTVGDRVYERIRNYQIRLLQPNALLQTEVSKYDRQSILEALHNCIAHMDYREGARITVREYPDRLVFENSGEFYDGDPSDYLLGDRTPSKYRNPLLVRAMTSLKMIDRIGYGIRSMSHSQIGRFLPLPDYELSPERVKLTVYGAQIDENYTELLMQRTDLPLEDVFALDRVQKGLPVPSEAVRRLRQAKLVEGRVPRLHISASLASATGTSAEYMRVREIEDEHFMALLVEYIGKFEPVKRSDLNDFLWDKLHTSLSDTQKDNKVKHLLRKLKDRQCIEVVGEKRGARWQIPKTQ